MESEFIVLMSIYEQLEGIMSFVMVRGVLIRYVSTYVSIAGKRKKIHGRGWKYGDDGARYF